MLFKHSFINILNYYTYHNFIYMLLANKFVIDPTFTLCKVTYCRYTNSYSLHISSDYFKQENITLVS